jgi:light-regulated signal transduction histidine kinase (bacteriophytochrome)
MPKGTLEIGCVDSVEKREVERFYANMATALHAMAQPLTVVRSAVVAAAAPGVNASDQRQYLDILSEQVERTCGLFQSLQQLVAVNQIKAERAPIEVSRLLAPVVESQTLTYNALGVEIQAVIPDGLRPMLGDMDRTLQALFAALQIAGSVSSASDVIELFVTSRNGFVELIVQNRRAHGRRLNSSERLSMVLAEANIRSQQGEFEYAEDPFCVSLMLPVLNIDQDIDT